MVKVDNSDLFFDQQMALKSADGQLTNYLLFFQEPWLSDRIS